MRASALLALVAGICAFCVLTAPAFAEPNDWVVRGEALARRIQAGNLVITASTRAERDEAAQHLNGQARLQALYDIASDDYVASDAEHAALTIVALDHEADLQASDRFKAMAAMLRAYAPALDGDYVAARGNLARALQSVGDPYVRAAGNRLLAYALTDLGLFGNSLEAARAGLVHLPDNATTLTLRSGLHDAMAYNAVRIGDYESGVQHLERTVELDTASGKPIDGATIVYNVSSMMAQAGSMDESLRLADIHRELASHTAMPAMDFFANLLCAKVHFLAHDYVTALRCAQEGSVMQEAPPEYLTRILIYRVHSLARLNRGGEARAALEQMRQMAAARGDPSLTEKLDAIEPEVLNAEGRYAEAFAAMRNINETGQANLMARFNDGVKELRATMESEVAQAEERAQSEQMRSELQARNLEKMTLAALLAIACLMGVLIIAYLIYKSRRSMLRAVGRAEDLLASRGADASVVTERASPMRRLNKILDEIERRDIELKAAFEALNAARIAAEDANLAKSQFLATMSHELRTPLNAIIGYSEMLMETVEGAEQEDLKRIHSAGHRLLSLINDVLDLSKIEAGRMTTSANRLDVAAMIEEIAATVKPAAAANSNEVLIERLGALGEADTDGFKLSQCLLNLMSNAAKFTRHGQVKLRAKRETRNGADWLCFEVVDTGIGISREAQERLFQPFMQADATTTRQFGGTGLGLAITRRLARLLGGDVTVKSVPGQGSSFSLRVPADLPVAKPDAANDQEGALSAA